MKTWSISESYLKRLRTSRVWGTLLFAVGSWGFAGYLCIIFNVHDVWWFLVIGHSVVAGVLVVYLAVFIAQPLFYFLLTTTMLHRAGLTQVTVSAEQVIKRIGKEEEVISLSELTEARVVRSSTGTLIMGCLVPRRGPAMALQGLEHLEELVGALTQAAPSFQVHEWTFTRSLRNMRRLLVALALVLMLLAFQSRISLNVYVGLMLVLALGAWIVFRPLRQAAGCQTCGPRFATMLGVRYRWLDYGFAGLILFLLAGAIWRGTDQLFDRTMPGIDEAVLRELQQDYEAEQAGQLGHLIEIPIQPMVELDYLSRADIYALRAAAVERHRELIEGDYRPTPEVFSSISDGKPWWGILGISYYGPGVRSSEGPSEQSRYIVNPFLLVGLRDSLAYKLHESELPPAAIWPEPSRLVWHIDRKFGRVTYPLRDYWRLHQRYHGRYARSLEFDILAYNARDFGFTHLAIDRLASRNLRLLPSTAKSTSILEFLHCGPNCGHPDGCCNNVSPDQPELRLALRRLPARVVIKLWRKEPRTASQPGDMVFVIDML